MCRYPFKVGKQWNDIKQKTSDDLGFVNGKNNHNNAQNDLPQSFRADSFWGKRGGQDGQIF